MQNFPRGKSMSADMAKKLAQISDVLDGSYKVEICNTLQHTETYCSTLAHI